jgi:hypothetical protein
LFLSQPQMRRTGREPTFSSPLSCLLKMHPYMSYLLEAIASRYSAPR